MPDQTTPSGLLGQPTPTHHHRGLHQVVDDLDDRDAEARYREEAADNTVGVHIRRTETASHAPRQPSPSHTPPHTQQLDEEQPKQLVPSLANSDASDVVAWEENDPENPYNWPNLKKITILIITQLTIINSTLGSSLPSNAIPAIAELWGVTSEPQRVLPMSTYLIGYILGPLVWAPTSEQIGRRFLSILTFALFIIWTMACALAPNWPAFLVFRLFTGIFASAPIALVTGILADIFATPLTRGRAMAAFMVTTIFGPLLAPIVSGYCSTTIGWRWSFWIALIYAGVCFVPLIFLLPETYGPILLQRRAQRLRAVDPVGNAHLAAPHELDRRSWREIAVVVLTRPPRMIVFELIVTCVCIYLSLVYAIFYMSFEAFPLIFEGVYGFSPGVDGLVFLSLGAGTLIAVPIFYAWDNYLLRATVSGAAWTKKEEYRRLPLACVGGPVFAISLFWLGWTSRASVSVAAPIVACIFFGLGFVLIFMALINYITDAYEIFAASANAAASCSRSLLATVLPLASSAMFTRLTIPGGLSLLGGFSLLMCATPFLFIWKGDRIRAGSRFCIALREQKAEMERKVEQQRHRQRLREQASQSSPPPGTSDGDPLDLEKAEGPFVVHDIPST